MKLFNNDDNNLQEKEVSSGALIGYVLIGFIVVVILAFGIFAASTTLKKGNETSNDQVNTEVIVETENNNEE